MILGRTRGGANNNNAEGPGDSYMLYYIILSLIYDFREDTQVGEGPTTTMRRAPVIAICYTILY